jgi:hypothetical protein
LRGSVATRNRPIVADEYLAVDLLKLSERLSERFPAKACAPKGILATPALAVLNLMHLERADFDFETLQRAEHFNQN